MAENVTLEFATKGIRRTLRRLEQVRDKIGGMERATKAVRRAMRGLRTAMVAATAAAGAIGAGMVALARKATDAGSQLEQAGIKLDSLFGSAQEGSEALAGLRDVARQLPFTFSEITEVAPTLAVISDSAGELQTRLAQAAEISARFGISLQETAGNMVRFFTAGASAADLFRERGVLQSLGVVAGEETTLQESKQLWQNFFRDIEESGSSALGRLADSFEGRLSMVQDAWFSLLASIAESGVMDAAKRALSEIQEAIEGFIASGQAEDFAQEFTNALAQMVGAIQGLVNVVAQTDDVIRDSFLGRIFGMERGPAGQLVQGQERLDQLRTLRGELQGGASLRNIRARAAQEGVMLPDRDLPSDQQRQLLLNTLDSAIQGVENQIDGPGGLSDQFSRASGLLGTFNNALDRVQAALRGEGAGSSGLEPPNLTGPTTTTGPPTTFGTRASQAQIGVGDTGEIASISGGAATILPETLREAGEVASDVTIPSLEDLSSSAGQGFRTIANTAISSMGAAVQAAVQGFDNIASVVINSVTQILQALSQSGGPLGGFLGGLGVPIFGAIGGILSAVVSSGGDDPQPVSIDGVNTEDEMPVREQNPDRPQSITLQLFDSSTGEKVDQIEYELRRRSRRDANQRLPGRLSMGLAGV